MPLFVRFAMEWLNRFPVCGLQVVQFQANSSKLKNASSAFTAKEKLILILN